MSKANVITIVVCSIITAVAISVMGIVWGMSSANIDQLKMQLNYTYQNNFYSLNDNINNIETNLSKLLVSKDEKMQEKYLTQIVSLCESSSNSLASLPLDHNALNQTTKFVNQLGGYAFSLHEKIVKGEDITDDDISQLEILHQSATQVKYELNRLANLINSGYSIVDNIADPNIRINNFSGEWNGVNNNTIEYPSLIYDGPFSDSVENKIVKGLSDKEINQTEAEMQIKKWFEGWNVNGSGETNGKDFTTWNFSLSKDDEIGYAQITKKGGLLLAFGSDVQVNAENKSLEECELLAQKFAEKVGIKDAKIVWSTNCEGFVYCNLVYVQDGVVVYPDMIKIKVSSTTGEIVGWEARSWAFNHIVRTNLKPTISKETAQTKIDPYLDVLSAKLTVIPSEYVGENLAWEFKALKAGSVYYVYIDAFTGEDRNIMKVIDTNDGELLM